MNSRLLAGALASLSTVCMAQESITLDAIEVQGNVQTIEERKENSIAKRIVRSDELVQYGDVNALELLKRLPGVSIPEGKTKKGQPGKGYTVVMIDGEETSTASRRRPSPLEQISPDMIERIEVMTNGSAEYTAESMGGIVNIVLKKPKEQGRTILKATGGAYGESPMGSLFAQREGKRGNLSYLANLTVSDNSSSDTISTVTRSGASVNDDERTLDIRAKTANLSTKLIYTPSSKDKYTFDGSLALHDATSSVDTLSYTSGSAIPSGVVRDHEQTKGVMGWTKLKGEHHLSGTELIEWKIKFHQNDADSNSFSNRTLPSVRTQTQDDESTFRVVGADGAYSLVLGDHFIKSGGEIKHQSEKDSVRRTLNGIDTTLPGDTFSMTQDKASLYVQDEWTPADAVILTPGIRYENVSRDVGNRPDTGYLAPSLHLLYKLTSSDNLRASVARTVRLPRLDELSTTLDSSLDQNDLRHPDVIGNPNLTEEKALSYELRYEHFSDDKGIASLGGFYRNLSDKIEKTISYDPLSGRYTQTPKNVGEGKLWGVELELKKPLAGLAEGLNVSANATFQNSSLINTASGLSRPIRQTSNVLYNVNLDHTLKPLALTYGAAYRYVGGYDDPLDEYGIGEKMKGYSTIDLYATRRINNTFKATLNLKNITGRKIETVSTYYDAAGILQQTQNYRENSRPQILLSLEAKW
ncbi:MAG: TonB-dependent receptor plug domain-containing protein [Sulfuricurvum sp.]